MFVLEQALSVKALQEVVNSAHELTVRLLIIQVFIKNRRYF